MSLLYKAVTTTRPVRVERIPDGTPVDLPEGTRAQVAQAMGTSFSLLVHGQMVRLKGVDADAIGAAPPAGIDIPADAGPGDVEGLVWKALRTCYDPEIPVDIVELGLVYGCDVQPMEGGLMKVAIRMTLTSAGCGMGEILAEEACDKVLALPHVGEATVHIVFDPPWDRTRMSEAAQLTLGL